MKIIMGFTLKVLFVFVLVTLLSGCSNSDKRIVEMKEKKLTPNLTITVGEFSTKLENVEFLFEKTTDKGVDWEIVTMSGVAHVTGSKGLLNVSIKVIDSSLNPDTLEGKSKFEIAVFNSIAKEFVYAIDAVSADIPSDKIHISVTPVQSQVDGNFAPKKEILEIVEELFSKIIEDAK